MIRMGFPFFIHQVIMVIILHFVIAGDFAGVSGVIFQMVESTEP